MKKTMHMARFVVFILFVVLGFVWLFENEPGFQRGIGSLLESQELLTLEVKYTPDQIMKSHRWELLSDAKHTFKEPLVKFHPHLLLEVKFTQPDKKTQEGVILWSQVDGEIVLNTDTWEKTNGFEDAIKARATRADFTIMNALAKQGGAMTRDKLIKDLKVDQETLDPWVDSARHKHLVIQKGNELQLHLVNPKIAINPQTKISQSFVKKNKWGAPREKMRYDKQEIEKIARAAFGQDFTIREIKQVFLPVYNIQVLNPDGSILSSEWNALNGKRIYPNYLRKV